MSLLRIGSVPYLNAAPLTFGIEKECRFLPPSQLAQELRSGNLDAALVSITEVLFHPGYEILDGYGIISDGEVYSVYLAHSGPIEQIETVHLDPASCTSANLIRVLLAARGIRPEFKPLDSYASAEQLNNVVLIGNPAIDFRRSQQSRAFWDLGKAWKDWTGLPFVYAVWALRKNMSTNAIRKKLANAAEAGLSAIPSLVNRHVEFDAEFRRRYLGGFIQYRLGRREREGIDRFLQLLEAESSQAVFPPIYVSPH